MTTIKKKEKPATAHGGVTRRSASAAAILGRPVAAAAAKHYEPVKIKPQWAKYYKRLLDLREQIQRQMSGLAKQSAEEVQGYSLHMADSGTDNFDRDFALSLVSNEQEALFEIEEAIKRIKAGTYGTCELTGKPISKDRLLAVPFARFSVESQMEIERSKRRSSHRGGVFGDTTTEEGSKLLEEEPE